MKLIDNILSKLIATEPIEPIELIKPQECEDTVAKPIRRTVLKAYPLPHNVAEKNHVVPPGAVMLNTQAQIQEQTPNENVSSNVTFDIKEEAIPEVTKNEGVAPDKNFKLTIKLITGEDNTLKDVSVLKKVIGQKEAINKILFFIDSHSETTPFPTMLFSGSQGLGKTFCSSKVAESLGRELVEVNCGNYSSGYDTVDRFITEVIVKRVIGDKPKTLLLDEAHELSPDIMTLLLTLLNPPVKGTMNYYAYGDFILAFDLSKINVIFATTDAYRILKPLVNRCVEVYFHPYSLDELHEMLKSYLPEISIECNKEDISYACRGRGRDTYILSQNIKRYSSMRNINVIDDKAWKEFKGIFGIHLNGLNSQEVGLLKVLKDNSPISSHNIALMLGVNERNVDSELEVRPRELGYIESGSRGRTISSNGIKYLTNLDETIKMDG